jgi:4-hydroxybenzoate polyprenyltransferase
VSEREASPALAMNQPASAATGSKRRGALALLEAMRPKQWTKNVFVFAGVTFAGRLLDLHALVTAAVCFFAFCAAASAVYLLNDVADRDADAHHPKKRERPIASGRLPVPLAAGAAVALAAAGLALAWSCSLGAAQLLLTYLAISFAYSARLKRVFLLDGLIVAVGFVLRAAAGAAAVSAEISPWLLCCTFLLALFLVLGKRRQELQLLGTRADQHRSSLSRYTAPLVDGWLSSLAGATIVAYALYTQSPRTVEHFRTTNLVFTVPFVVYALFRYQAMVVNEDSGGDPTSAVLKDRGILLAIFGWSVTVAAIIYR